jgi:hypothetical protein
MINMVARPRPASAKVPGSGTVACSSIAPKLPAAMSTIWNVPAAQVEFAAEVAIPGAVETPGSAVKIELTPPYNPF